MWLLFFYCIYLNESKSTLKLKKNTVKGGLFETNDEKQA
jgi:hypothetical protein